MRSSKAKNVLKSFKELKTLLDNRPVPLRNCPAAVAGPVPPQPTAESERRLFRSAMADVTPIKSRNRIKKTLSPTQSKPLPPDPEKDTLIQLTNLIRRGDGFVLSDTPEYMEGTGYRVPGRFAQRLHQGDFSIQSFIDLHGLSVDAAKETL
jgi:DNA-nicking Smr family endonuclease